MIEMDGGHWLEHDQEHCDFAVALFFRAQKRAALDRKWAACSGHLIDVSTIR